jgi:hypothetical protein
MKFSQISGSGVGLAQNGLKRRVEQTQDLNCADLSVGKDLSPSALSKENEILKEQKEMINVPSSKNLRK